MEKKTEKTKKKRVLGKRGIETKIIIGIIITLICAGIIFMFLRLFPFVPVINKETCHTTIMARAVPFFSKIAEKSLPLKCKTEDLCISMGKKCTGHYDRLIRVKDENEIKAAIAEELQSCF